MIISRDLAKETALLKAFSGPSLFAGIEVGTTGAGLNRIRNTSPKTHSAVSTRKTIKRVS